MLNKIKDIRRWNRIGTDSETKLLYVFGAIAYCGLLLSSIYAGYLEEVTTKTQ